MTACKFFAQGRCTYGSSCRNSHEAALARPPLCGKPDKLGEAQEANFLVSEVASTPTIYQKTQERDVKAPCWFFAQGKCTFGASCRLSHDVSSAQTQLISNQSASLVPKNKSQPIHMKPEALVFEPGRHHISALEKADGLPCSFFAKGFCRNGLACQFKHETIKNLETPEKPSQPTRSIPRDGEPLEQLMQQLLISDCIVRTIHGATVTFNAGAKVSNVKLPSDFSTIQVSGLLLDADTNTVRDIMFHFGFDVAESRVQVRNLGATSVAEVTMDDPMFAGRVIEKSKVDSRYGRLSFKPIISSGTSGELGNRLQLSTVSCTWYQASRIAWLEYGHWSNADAAIRRLSRAKIRQRTPSCTIQPRQTLVRRGALQSYTIQVGTLHPKTEERDLKAILNGPLTPRKITLGVPSHAKSDAEAASIVENLFRLQGGLELFQYQVVEASGKIKATASFTDRDRAASTVKLMHDHCIKELGNSKIYVAHVVSVKYNILTAIITAIRTDLDAFKDKIWKSYHLQLKTYPQTDPRKPFTALRLFGEDVKDVSKAKVELEKLLAGDVIMQDDSVLWDPWFAQAISLAHLNDISQAHKVYLYRNIRRSQIVLYGAMPDKVSEIALILADKVKDLNIRSHSIVLTADLLAMAMQGGMKRLKARFGSSVHLNVALNPKTISIGGSMADVAEARVLLSASDNVLAEGEEAEDCVVCWTEASEPLLTSCGHVYCRDCFSNQVSSVGAPVRCHGAEGKCEKLFSINELEKLLSYTEFEALLQEAYDSFIHTHPKDFQYCPTPDCPQVYRISALGQEFLCSSCLSTICTACQVINHDGMSCEDYKDLSSEDTRTFQKWKKENDARDCPSCKVAIQKSYGCNHMECKNCFAHICWFCMEIFDTGAKCYSHMGKAHGNHF